MKQTYLIFSLILFSTLIGCKNIESTNEENPIDTTKISSSETNNLFDLKEKLETREKLFLKFWEGMSNEEFDTVAKILIAEKKLSGKTYTQLYYDIASANVEIRPNFDEGKLSSIDLLDAEKIYPALAQNYNLPKLVEKNIGGSGYVESNPDFESSFIYKSSNGQITNLPYFFSDSNNSQIFGGKKIVIEDNIQKTLLTNPLIVRKPNVMIVVEQKILPPNLPLTFYSLEDNEQVSQYLAENRNELGLLGGKELVRKHSRSRIIKSYNQVVIDISYKSLSKFEKDQKDLKENSMENMNERWKKKEEENNNIISKDL